jgi:hypothetical protein
MASNPYASPKARVDDDARAAAPAAPIWNPNAAASWSLLLSPAFGSYLHMLNWRALGEHDKAATAKGWFVTSVAVLLLYIVLDIISARVADAVSRGLGIGLLLAWYFAAAKGQARYVKEAFGDSYPRRGWGKPLLIAVGLGLLYMLVAFGVAVVFGTLPPA